MDASFFFFQKLVNVLCLSVFNIATVGTVWVFITSLAWDALIPICCQFGPLSLPHFDLLKMYNRKKHHTQYKAVQNKQLITN